MTNAKTVTASEMKEIEKRADKMGLSYYQMMENAGRAAYDVIRSECDNISGFMIFCGKGNNGGDGFVVARLAALDGYKVSVILVEGEPVTADALTNFGILPANVEVFHINDDYGIDAFTNNMKLCKPNWCAVIVDALYGTGFHGELRESGRKACDMMNRTSGYKVALDLPSGCQADTGEAADGALSADITVSFDSWKMVHKAGICNTGKCILADIGIPDSAHEAV